MVLKSKVYDKKVLVVDDDPAIHDLFDVFLKNMGEIRIIHAHDSFDAVRKAKNERFDMIFTDYYMPRVSGTEFIDTIRRTSENMDTPIVMMTPKPDEIDFSGVDNTDGLYFLKKPLKASNIKDAIFEMPKREVKTAEKVDLEVINTVMESFQQIMKDFANFDNFRKGPAVRPSKKNRFFYDYFGSVLIHSDSLNALITLGFPSKTFEKLAGELDYGQNSMEDALESFMDVFLSKTKTSLADKGISTRSVHQITGIGDQEQISSKDAMLEFVTTFASDHGHFFMQIDIWNS